MSENSPVKEKGCDERRKDLYVKYGKLKEVQDQMKGGIRVLCYGVPIMLAVFGWLGKRELDRIYEAVKYQRTVSTGSAVSVEWSETENRLVPVDTVKGEPAATLREMPASKE